MDFIVSLAHFCEVHGPTTILCTHILPLTCTTCFPTTSSVTEALSKNSSFSSSFWEPSSPVLTPGTGPLFSPFTSPPNSPRSPSTNYNPYFPSIPGEGPHARRFSFGSESETDACDNCNLIVPKSVSGRQESPTKDGKDRSSSPVLRTVNRIVAYGSDPAYGEEEDDEVSPTSSDGPHSNLGTSPTPSQESTGGSSGSGGLYNSMHKHMHNLTYVTRRQPESQSVYSRLRHSCIRTLSCEQLPRGTSSGPILFGDPYAGYTVAYMFRLPDPRARGRKRVYALTALSHDCRRVTNAFVPIVRAFESIARRILAMTDRVLERESDALVSKSSHPDLALRTPPLSASLPSAPVGDQTPSSPPVERARSNANSPISSQRNLDVSSFLSAKKLDPDGYPRMSREVIRAKGLPEIVGKESFFVDLHADFCRILSFLVNDLPR